MNRRRTGGFVGNWPDVRDYLKAKIKHSIFGHPLDRIHVSNRRVIPTYMCLDCISYVYLDEDEIAAVKALTNKD